MKIKVLFDHQTFDQKVGGVSRYFTNLFPFFDEFGGEFILSCRVSNNLYLEKLKVRKFFPFLQEYQTLLKIMKIINQYFSIQVLKKGGFDVFHPTQNDLYYLDFINKPLVITVHDMIPYLYSINPLDVLDKNILIPKANYIIAISENTKKDIIQFFPDLNPDKIKVIHHGYYQEPYNLVSNKYGNYILFVGQRSGYKNFDNFLEAIIPILQKDSSLNLVCTGKPFNTSEIEKMTQASIESRCFCSYFTDDELFSLYKHAKVFVYPSQYEGFGLPILEAYSNNCPICISDASCFPEIAGDAALYFDPLSVNSIKESIEKVIYSEKVAKTLIEKGKERIKHFSLEKCAKLHFELYKSMCKLSQTKPRKNE